MKLSEYPIIKAFKSDINLYINNTRYWQRQLDKLIADDMSRLEFESKHEQAINAINEQFDALMYEYQTIKATNYGNKLFHAYVKRLFTEAIKKA